MNKVIRSLKPYPVATFCTLTVLLSFAAYFTPLPRAAIPFVLVLIPAVLAIVLVALLEGRAAVRTLLGRLTRRRIGLKWAVFALALALIMRLAVSIIAQLLGLMPAVQLLPANPVQALILALIFLVAALFEELGWRGFALSRLLARHPPFLAALLLGLPWGVIHLVLHLPGMWAEGLPWLPTVVQLVALSLIITWLFVSSGQSVLIVTLFHAAQSAFGFVNEGISPLHIHWLMTAIWSATALLALLALAAAPRLRHRPLPAV